MRRVHHTLLRRPTSLANLSALILTAVVATTTASITAAAIASTSAAAPTPATAAPALFINNRTETFALKSLQNKPIEFDVLDDTAMERALGLAIVTALNSQKDFQPKLDPSKTVRLHIESLSFSPEKPAADELSLQAKVSGHWADLPEKVSKTELLAGKQILVKFNPKERSVSAFNIGFKGGQFKLQLNPQTQVLTVSDANARLEFEAPFLGKGTQELAFSGRGTRQLK